VGLCPWCDLEILQLGSGPYCRVDIARLGWELVEIVTHSHSIANLVSYIIIEKCMS
jgi:hypothetical protein